MSTVITTEKLHGNKPPTKLNWAGQPIPEEEGYGGRPEHFSDAQRKAEAPRSEETLQRQREAMAHAREVAAERRKKEKK
jgi:hypothetical protein